MARRGSVIDFCGYRFRPGCTLLRKSIKQNFARKIHRIKSKKRRMKVLASYWGWCKYGNCKNIWKNIAGNMSFAELGIRQTGRSVDGKRYFDMKTYKISDVANESLTIVDFEADVKTKQGGGRYCVVFELNGRRGKFITNSYNIKDVLDQARKIEQEEGREIFPVKDVVIRYKSLGGWKSTYYFEE